MLVETPDFIRGYSGWTLRVQKVDSRFRGNDTRADAVRPYIEYTTEDPNASGCFLDSGLRRNDKDITPNIKLGAFKRMSE